MWNCTRCTPPLSDCFPVSTGNPQLRNQIDPAPEGGSGLPGPSQWHESLLAPESLTPLSYLGSGRHRDLLLPSPLWTSSVSSCELFFGCVCLKRGCSLGSTDSPLTRVGLSFTMSTGKTPKPLAPALSLVQSIGPTVKASWTDLQLVVSQAPQTNFIPELNASPPHTHLVLIRWTGGLQSVAHGTKTGTPGKCR